MAQALDVCIRGGGVVGRTLALLLARTPLRVGLVAPGLSAAAAPATHLPGADVRAYALNAAARETLESVRGWPAAEAATPVLHMKVWGDLGGEVGFDAAQQGVEALTWIVDVPALEARLADAIRFQPTLQVLAQPQPAALTVVCEGKASATRAELGVEFQVSPYGQHAVATRVHCEKPHGQTARQWFSGGRILAFLPLDGPQGNSVAVVWSVEQDEAVRLMSLDAPDFCAELASASHQALGTLELSGERAHWPLQKANASRWVGSTAAEGPTRAWALAGDAAHTVHPLAGQGLNLGLGDAAELARVLREREYWRSVADPKVLRRYERARKAAVATLGTANDGIQRLFAHADGIWPTLRNWGMNGFERSGPLKTWVAQQAMGLHTKPASAKGT